MDLVDNIQDVAYNLTSTLCPCINIHDKQISPRDTHIYVTRKCYKEMWYLLDKCNVNYLYFFKRKEDNNG